MNIKNREGFEIEVSASETDTLEHSTPLALAMHNKTHDCFSLTTNLTTCVKGVNESEMSSPYKMSAMIVEFLGDIHS